MYLKGSEFMKKVALYLRTSTEIQVNGLDSQLKALEGFCKSKDITDFLIFKDSGISGTKSNRPALDELMAKVRNNEISSVVVYSFSRFARSTKHLLTALDEFNERQVSFISISESIDTTTPIGRTIFTILSGIAQLEAELIRERVKNGMLAAKARGSQIGAKKIHTNPLPFIELKKSGMTTREIAKVLKCSPMTVVRMLKQSVPVSSLNAS
jgi:DNA invertase Pin-like site-specific DNA recombinase